VLLTLGLDSRTVPLHGDAGARVAQKTPLGESFVDLSPGRRGPRPAQDARIAGRDSVEIDEALGVLDARGRTDATAILKTLARGARAPRTDARLNATLVRLRAAADAADRLTTTLDGQQANIAGTVDATRTILTTLAAHRGSVRAIVAGADTTLRAIAAQRRDLEAILAAAPPLLVHAREVLANAAPLIADARPLVSDVRAAAPGLTTALRQTPAVLDDANTLIAQAPALRAAADPALNALDRLLPVATPAIRHLGPALADVVPIVRYFEPRANTIAAWFANTADLGSNGDAKGKWARFFILFDPNTAFGISPGPPGNTYTTPGDAAHNKPYQPGDYPRLVPFAPALSGGTR
jgi:ABC-type transporter Mla subunit MlaD